MKKKAGSWPDDFALTDNLALFAKERGFDPLDEFDDFRDWAAANPSKAQYADWPAAFRTRIRNKARWGAKPVSRPIGFTKPVAIPASVKQALQDNELAAQETRTMTTEQRRAASQKFSKMISEIK